MTVLRRLVYREVSGAVALVTLAFLGLFFFFDFIDELGAIGRPSPIDPKAVYQLKDALLQVALQVPSHAYEVLPIAVLIGAIFVFARLAQGSEYTILRTSGLGPWRALRMMLGLGLVFVAITFVVGDYLAPAAGKAAQLQKAQFQGRVNVGGSGAWLKEKQAYSQYSVNVLALNGRGELEGIRIFEFDNQGRLVTSGGLLVSNGVTVPATATALSISQDGQVTATLPGTTGVQTIGTITTASFINPAGLEPKGQNIFGETAASGQPNAGTPGANGLGPLMQGFVETSNVNVVQELVSMIQTQRAYEMNSKAIQTSDQMLQKLGQL